MPTLKCFWKRIRIRASSSDATTADACDTTFVNGARTSAPFQPTRDHVKTRPRTDDTEHHRPDPQLNNSAFIAEATEIAIKEDWSKAAALCEPYSFPACTVKIALAGSWGRRGLKSTKKFSEERIAWKFLTSSKVVSVRTNFLSFVITFVKLICTCGFQIPLQTLIITFPSLRSAHDSPLYTSNTSQKITQYVVQYF